MNDIQRTILKHIRSAISDPSLKNLEDDKLVRMIFFNFRGGSKENARGLRLTNFGLQILQGIFQFVEIKFPEGHKLNIPEILYFDHRASLPYYISDDHVVVFEAELGMKLKLADGDVDTLMDIEGSDKIYRRAHNSS